jgi:UDP-glucose 4-epimerase
VDRLITSDHVTIFDNFSSGKKEFLGQHEGNDKLRIVEGDLLDADAIRRAMEGHDFVFHLAANPDVRMGEKYPRMDVEQGPIATSNLLEAMRAHGVKKIAFSSSSVVYGEVDAYPTPESYGPCFPISMYGAGKLAAEGLVTAYCSTFGMRSWIFRFANVIGSRGTHGVLVDFINKLKKDPGRLEILGNGKQRKSYLLVEDCVDGMMFAIENSDEEVNLFNLGTEDQINVTRIAEILVEELGLENVKFDYTGGDRGWAGDVRIMLLGTKKIRDLGWKPKAGSEGSIRATIKLLKAEMWD